MSGWHKTSRHARGYGSKWVKLRALIMQRDSYLCQPCWRKGRPTPATSVDHIKPKAMGGTDDPSNLECTCDDCHKAKTKAEAAQAQGRTVKQRLGFDEGGNPIWPE
jgi:5-methylcytosine-specific restriction protein A